MTALRAGVGIVLPPLSWPESLLPTTDLGAAPSWQTVRFSQKVQFLNVPFFFLVDFLLRDVLAPARASLLLRLLRLNEVERQLVVNAAPLLDLGDEVLVHLEPGEDAHDERPQVGVKAFHRCPEVAGRQVREGEVGIDMVRLDVGFQRLHPFVAQRVAGYHVGHPRASSIEVTNFLTSPSSSGSFGRFRSNESLKIEFSNSTVVTNGPVRLPT